MSRSRGCDLQMGLTGRQKQGKPTPNAEKDEKIVTTAAGFLVVEEFGKRKATENLGLVFSFLWVLRS